MPDRLLIITADDFGIGPETSRGILELAAEGIVTATVLLVNSPHAEDAVRAWLRAGRPALGWHPCLTLDRPVLAPRDVPSLVQPDGHFWPLRQFLWRWLCGRLRGEEVEAELRAQCERFHELTGSCPTVVNGHHHIHHFAPVAAALRRIFEGPCPAPYLRRVVEPVRTLLTLGGARGKRAILSLLGRRSSDFPGNAWLIGLTDPARPVDAGRLKTWLTRLPPGVVEFVCHPGRFDPALLDRDVPRGRRAENALRQRVREMNELRSPRMREAIAEAGYRLVAPRDLIAEGRHAA